jgi:hypothetical protein
LAVVVNRTVLEHGVRAHALEGVNHIMLLVFAILALSAARVQFPTEWASKLPVKE